MVVQIEWQRGPRWRHQVAGTAGVVHIIPASVDAADADAFRPTYRRKLPVEPVAESLPGHVDNPCVRGHPLLSRIFASNQISRKKGNCLYFFKM